MKCGMVISSNNWPTSLVDMRTHWELKQWVVYQASEASPLLMSLIWDFSIQCMAKVQEINAWAKFKRLMHVQSTPRGNVLMLTLAWAYVQLFLYN